jgi:hypothetical protein
VREAEVILETVRDVALCSAITVGVVVFCALGRLAGWGRSP